MSAQELADRTGLSRDRVRSILQGDDAALDEIRIISSKLRIPFSKFRASEKERKGDIDVLFRRVGNLDHYLDPTREYVTEFVFASLNVLPPRDHLPEWLNGLVPESEDYQTAELLAEEVRRRISPDNLHEPIPNLAVILGSRANVVVGRLSQSRFEGASLVAGNYPFIFVSPRFPGRMLFTIAHELGHLVAHHPSGEPPIFERASEIGGWRQRRREAFVDAFASIFLMPSRGVGMALANVRRVFQISGEALGDLEILILARFFGVSFEVAARRCEALDLLPEGGARSLNEMLKEKYGSAEKRAQEAKLPPRVTVPIPALSPILGHAVSSAIENEQISIGWAAEKFQVPINALFDSKKQSDREYNS